MEIIVVSIICFTAWINVMVIKKISVNIFEISNMQTDQGGKQDTDGTSGPYLLLGFLC